MSKKAQNIIESFVPEGATASKSEQVTGIADPSSAGVGDNGKYLLYLKTLGYDAEDLKALQDPYEDKALNIYKSVMRGGDEVKIREMRTKYGFGPEAITKLSKQLKARDEMLETLSLFSEESPSDALKRMVTSSGFQVRDA